MFLGYINDLTKILINNSILILCADDTGVIITNANIVDFQSNTKAVFIKKKKKKTCNLDIVTEYDNRRISNIYKIHGHIFGQYSILENPYRSTSTLAYYTIRVIKQTMAQCTFLLSY